MSKKTLKALNKKLNLRNKLMKSIYGSSAGKGRYRAVRAKVNKYVGL